MIILRRLLNIFGLLAYALYVISVFLILSPLIFLYGACYYLCTGRIE